MLCMVGAGNGVGMGMEKANWHCWGGSSRGDDQRGRVILGYVLCKNANISINQCHTCIIGYEWKL